jgi:hypothetical protein
MTGECMRAWRGRRLLVQCVQSRSDEEALLLTDAGAAACCSNVARAMRLARYECKDAGMCGMWAREWLA